MVTGAIVFHSTFPNSRLKLIRIATHGSEVPEYVDWIIHQIYPRTRQQWKTLLGNIIEISNDKMVNDFNINDFMNAVVNKGLLGVHFSEDYYHEIFTHLFEINLCDENNEWLMYYRNSSYNKRPLDNFLRYTLQEIKDKPLFEMSREVVGHRKLSTKSIISII